MIPRRGRLLLALTMAMMAFVVLAPAASATRAWCRSDPLLLIDGEIADVFVSGPLLAPLMVTGPTKVNIVVPEGVDAQLILTDLGFGRGYDVTITESSKLRKTWRGTQVHIRVYVPASDNSMPVVVEFAPRLLGILWPDRAEGTANEWINLKVLF